jgi:Mg-chelatase subunit ChlD
LTDGSDRPLDGGVDLGSYDLAMLDDRPASKVPEAFQARLTAAVREQGLGLLFSGGKSSFGTGGYDRTAVADILPVDLIQRSEERDPSTALAVIIDTSGSMGGIRIELAKQIVRLTANRLKAQDRIGIVEFYGNKHWALPLQSAANKIEIERAVGRMQAIGGTVLYPAIEEAYYGLKNVNTRYKHILIITDGGVEDADFETIARRIAKDNINISTVLVSGGSQSQVLIDLAAWGRGRFYSASDRYSLPEPVLKQATTMNLPAYKTGEFVVAGHGGPGWWGEVARDSVPPLDGYVETQGRPGAEVLLETLGSSQPLLATWQYGLGRVTAFMSEPLGEGTAGWKSWKDYGRWLARIASRTSGDMEPFRFDAVRDDDRISVVARRYGGSPDLAPQASLLDAQGKPSVALDFRRVAPDRYVAGLVMDPAKEARMTAGAEPAGGSRDVLLVSNALDDVSPEGQVDPDSGLDLASLAKATGGAYQDASKAASLGAAPAPAARPGSLSLFELWPYAALLALLIYVAEVAYRRWPRDARAPARS